MENAIDNLSSQNTDGIMTSQERNKLILFIAILIVINLIIGYFSPAGQATHLNGKSATEEEIKSSVVIAILFSFPLFGFVIATLISFIPYKKLPYSKKYLRFSLVTILVIQILILILSILRLI